MKENQYSALRTKILAGMMVVPIIPFILIVLIGYYYFTASLQSGTIAKLTRVVNDHREMIESFLDERTGDLRYVAETHHLSELARQEILSEVFVNLQLKSSAFTDLGVFDENGVHLAYHGPFDLAGKIYKETEWFQAVLREGVYLSDVFLGYRKVPHSIIAVVKQEGEKKWVLRATIDASLFSRIVEKVRIGKSGEAYILDKEGKFQTARRSGGELMQPDPDLKPPLRMHDGVSTFVGRSSGGEEYLYATTWLKSRNWLLVVRVEKDEVFEALKNVTYLVVLTALIGGLLIVIVAFQVTRRIIGRLETVDTEKKELGRQLVVAGRLAEIGEMSAGFAHEINNPLQIMKSELTLIDTLFSDLRERGELKDSADLADIIDSLKQIKSQVDRCGGITQGLLKFARKKESQAKPLNLNTFLPEVTRLIESKASVEGIEINYDLSEGVPEVQADPAHLEQVMVNLLNNAIYAIVEQHGSYGGQIELGAKPSSDNKVVISLKDNGAGISPENLQKIFTPFFSTKPVGQGTGLGLSICYGIIAEMGGFMEVESRKGVGTTFYIHLPKA